MIDMYIQMAIALVFVIGLIIAMGYFLKKKQSKAGIMTILSYQAFGPKKAIAAINIGKDILLVAITPTDLKLLKTYHQKELESDVTKDMSDKLVKLRNIKEGLYESK